VLLDLSNTKDMDLVARTRNLRDTEHASLTELLQHLIEIEKRRLDLDMGFRSLFDYCVNDLEYSASAAGRRIQAARCIHRYPVVLEMLEKHELSLTTISQIEPILTDENYQSILERVRGASQRDVEKVACEFRPPLKLKDRVRPVVVAEMTAARNDPDAGPTAKLTKKMLVQFLASEELVEKFEQVKVLLSAGNPSLSFADVVEVLANEYLDRHSPAARQERREARQESKQNGHNEPEKRSASPDSRRRECEKTQPRHIPKQVRDFIFIRDENRCTFRAADGTRCTATRGLQIDHIKPVANGGEHDLKNLRLLCATHNRRSAELAMGMHVMNSYWRRGTDAPLAESK
jgi:5-methylcytosine-specific restriction endonuclease McrA